MTWIDIVPQRGLRITHSPGVTVAWRIKAYGRPQMAVTLSSDMAKTLGWSGKHRVAVRHNPDQGLLHLARTEREDRSFAVHAAKESSVVAVSFMFPAVTLTSPQRAEAVEHRVEDGALILSLPKWATGPQPPAQPAPPRPPLPPRTAKRPQPPQGAPQAPSSAPAATPVAQKALKAASAPLAAPQKLPSNPLLVAVLKEDLDEARKMMASPKVGARDLSTYFGWEHDVAVRVAAMIRDEMAAAVFERGKVA